jgi:homoserine kinase
MSKITATAFAPASVGNVAVGFDILGFALEAIGDTVTATITPNRGMVQIESVAGPGGVPINLPAEPDKNTATAGLVRMLHDRGNPFGLRVKIQKGIPLGSGMGGSAASAVAGVVAANALFPKPFEPMDLMKYALIGERVASGAKHGDNVGPSLLGGLVLVTQVEPVPRAVRLPVPRQLYGIVVHPPIQIETKAARAMLRLEVPLKHFVQQSGHLAGFLAGCFQGDFTLMGQNLVDVVIEPQRASLIKGFKMVQTAALQAGALGCSISGAGPAVFALAHDEIVTTVRTAMVRAFEGAGIKGCDSYEAMLSAPGAKVIEG